MQFAPELKPVTTICYGEERKWERRVDAMEFFWCGVISCDGAERDRYVKVLTDLELMKDVCTDGSEVRRKKRT